MLKIMTIIGTRPELIKMSRVIAGFDKHFTHILVHTGQNYDYELNQIFFDELDIRKPDYFLNTATGNTAKTIANIISKSDEVFDIENPDAVLIYGDTNSCLSVISAKKRKIPIFHMEAGNRCFDQRVPEEINRKIIDHLSDINLVLTEHARGYLIREGIKPETIFKTGTHMEEVLNYYESKINNSVILDSLCLKEGEYFVFSSHREENVDDLEKVKEVLKSLNKLVDKYNHPIIASIHPRTKKQLDKIDLELNDKIILCPPFGFFDYIKLQMYAKCTISDSGTLTEESTILGFPAVMIRETHERPEGMDNGVLIMTDTDTEDFLHSVDVAIRCNRPIKSWTFNLTNLDVSKQIIKIVLSYINYINRTVWNK